MGSIFENLAAITGGSVAQIKLLACVISCYPLGNIYVRIPRTWPGTKHLFSVIVSLLILGPIMNVWFGALQLVCITLLIYFLTATIRSRLMPWVVFAVVMGHLTVIHAHTALHEVAYRDIIITGPLMVLVMKLSTFAWNIHDGRRPVEELDTWQKNHRITKFPTVLEFLGYAFFFPGILVGPFTEYVTYSSLIDGSYFATAQSGDKNRYVPRGRKRVAYTKMLIGFAFLGVYVFMNKAYSLETVLHDTWLSKSLFTRIAELQFLCFVERSKYYSIWILAEGAAILTGLGFNGYTTFGGSRWDGAANVDVLQVEFPSNIKTYLDSWNIKTNTWLRETAYKRVARKGKKPGSKSTIFTFLLSAYWHGFRVGPYLTFMLGGFASVVARQCRKRIRPYFISATDPNQATVVKRLYDILGTITTILTMNFIGAPYFSPNVHDAVEIWSRVNWFGLWMIIPPFILFQILPPAQTVPGSEKREGVKTE